MGIEIKYVLLRKKKSPLHPVYFLVTHCTEFIPITILVTLYGLVYIKTPLTLGIHTVLQAGISPDVSKGVCCGSALRQYQDTEPPPSPPTPRHVQVTSIRATKAVTAARLQSDQTRSGSCSILLPHQHPPKRHQLHDRTRY